MLIDYKITIKMAHGNPQMVTVHSLMSGTAFRSTWAQPCVRV